MSDAGKSPSLAGGAESSVPHLEVIDRVMNIPVVQSAIEKTNSTYSLVKDSHHLINWALNYAEAGLQYAKETVGPIAAPLAKDFEAEISSIDQKLCQGLDIVEQKVPMVMQPPNEIYDAAMAVLNSKLEPTIERLTVAKESASSQASALNEILNADYGTLTVQGVDNTSALVNRLLDHFFPPVEGEEYQEAPAPVSADENKVLHAVQTISQLSSKTANRVYHSVVAQLKTMKKEDVQWYLSCAVNIIKLISFLINLRDQRKSG